MTVLQGVPVVPGVRFAPVIRTSRLPALADLDAGGEIAEEQRPAESARFTTAAAAVAQRQIDRATAHITYLTHVASALIHIYMVPALA